jgi:hypothetical protein
MTRALRLPLLATLLLTLALSRVSAAEPAAKSKPVLLYSLRYQAPGENRYPADGSYQPILNHLRATFEVRVSAEPPSPKLLRDVAVVLIANPNENAVTTNPPPVHLERADLLIWASYLQDGGGLILLGNQEGHNLEITRFNELLGRCGMSLTNRYHDAKLIAIPGTTPVIGGLRWAYYTGNEVLLQPAHPAHPRAWVVNDASSPTATGKRNEAGILLAVAEPVKGRIVVATDAGWLSRNALEDIGIGGVILRNHQNAELFERLALWAAHRR